MMLHRQRGIALEDALADKGLDVAIEQRRAESVVN
jgi:hypothetical protein